jgi:hypothetical protein
MFAVPMLAAVTSPPVPTDAVPGASLLHVAPVVVLVSVVVLPRHMLTTGLAGIMAAGVELTVTVVTVAHVPTV